MYTNVYTMGGKDAIYILLNSFANSFQRELEIWGLLSDITNRESRCVENSEHMFAAWLLILWLVKTF